MLLEVQLDSIKIVDFLLSAKFLTCALFTYTLYLCSFTNLVAVSAAVVHPEFD